MTAAVGSPSSGFFWPNPLAFLGLNDFGSIEGFVLHEAASLAGAM
jgi:hypothetical protein